MLRALSDEIWLADGPVVEVASFRYPTRMAIVRLPGRRLFVWSPVALSEPLRAAVDALGEVSCLIAPNKFHHLALAEWQRAYPAARLHAPPGLRERRGDLRIDADLADAPDAAWLGQLDQTCFAGNVLVNEVVFFHQASRTILFADLIQHFPADWFTGWRALIARLDLMAAAQPEVPRKFRLAFVDRRAARASLDRVLAWPVKNIVMAHGEPVLRVGRRSLERAFRWLLS